MADVVRMANELGLAEKTVTRKVRKKKATMKRKTVTPQAQSLSRQALQKRVAEIVRMAGVFGMRVP